MTVEDNVGYGLQRQGRAARRARPPRRRDARAGAARARRRTAGRPSSRAACSSASRSRARSSTARACCCSTSRSARSTASCARTCRSSCAELHSTLGTTFIYVTHDQEEALSMSDRLVVMRDGEIEQLGEPGDGLRLARDALGRRLRRREQPAARRGSRGRPTASSSRPTWRGSSPATPTASLPPGATRGRRDPPRGPPRRARAPATGRTGCARPCRSSWWSAATSRSSPTTAGGLELLARAARASVESGGLRGRRRGRGQLGAATRSTSIRSKRRPSRARRPRAEGS